MSEQQFVTANVIALEVQEPWPGLPNLIANPSGRDGASGWLASTISGGVTAVPGPRLRLGMLNGSTFTVYDAAIPEVTVSGRQVRAWVRRVAGTSGRALRIVFQFLDETRTVIGTSSPSSSSSANGATIASSAVAVPIGTRYLRMRVECPTSFEGEFIEFDRATMVTGTSAQVAAATHFPEPSWVNIIGPAHEISLERSELQVGVLNATILNASLDPSQHSLIRPGRGVRLRTVAGGGEMMLTGKIQAGKVAYDLKAQRRSESKRTQIQLTAVDLLTTLANTPRAEGVETIPELPYVLDGTGVPYRVNGQTPSLPASSVTVVSINENASAVDQVALTRDTRLGYAWLCRRGIVQVWDRDLIPTAIAAVYDEDDYSDLDIDFDTERCINTVTVKVQSVDPVTGEGTETTHGPYVDDNSVREWGARAAEFTVHGLDEPEIKAYAAAILAANATPQVRINRVVLPILTAADITTKALRDLYDRVTVSNNRAGRTQTARVTAITQRITTTGWFVELSFAAEGSVAPPQVIPSPPTTNGLTLAQRLRPVGEVTPFYGLPSQVPPGWLICNGATFSATTYPRLRDHLQALVSAGLHTSATTLPNMVDRFPIGAGNKALGAQGGSPTVVLAPGNYRHTHVAASTNAAAIPRGTGTADAAPRAHQHDVGEPVASQLANVPVDVMNPWRAVHFIIRAA